MKAVPRALALEYNTDALLAWTYQKHEAAARKAVLGLKWPEGSSSPTREAICRVVDPPQLLKCPQRPQVAPKWRLPGKELGRSYIEKEGRDVLLQKYKSRCTAMEALVQWGGSIFGNAGTGKSYTLKRVLAEMDARGITYKVLCPTHCSARIHKDARTVASFVHKMFARGRVPRAKVQFLIRNRRDRMGRRRPPPI